MFDSFGKVYILIKDLAVRRMYVDPDSLLFMFYLPTLIIYINEFLYPPSNVVLKMATNPMKNTVIRRYQTKKSGVMTGYPALRLDAVLMVCKKSV